MMREAGQKRERASEEKTERVEEWKTDTQQRPRESSRLPDGVITERRCQSAAEGGKGREER